MKFGKIFFIFLIILFRQTITAPIKVYFAGPLFSIQEITGNELLARAIQRLSNNKYQIVLPQRLEQEHDKQKQIRNNDLRNLLSCQAIIVNFNSTEIDSGTVVEYMFAKFVNMPAVMLRTDYRNNDVDNCLTFNLLVKFYPRTTNLYLDALGIFHNKQLNLNATIDTIATRIINKLNKAMAIAPILVGTQKTVVNNWVNTLIAS